jgi:hypothetical protein
MNSHGQILSPMKLQARKNWLWLWFLPAAMAWLLVSLAGPTGGAAIWVQLAIICLCSCFFGFTLAIKSFSKLQERFWGGLFFSAGSLCLLSSVLFLGCFGPTAAEIRKGRLQQRRQISKQIVPRDAQADTTMLDLTSFYDELLPGQGYQLPSNFRVLEPGTHAWEGIEFDVRGCAMSHNQPNGKIVGIPVNQKCLEMAFLHGAYGFERTNRSSQFVIHFANGYAEIIPIVFGKDVVSSFFWKNRGALNLSMTNSVVWLERISTNGPAQPDIRFFIKKWNNPFPEETVTTIDFVPSSLNVDAFLVAITVRPVNP